jgi:hypothetical protein
MTMALESTKSTPKLSVLAQFPLRALCRDDILRSRKTIVF